MTDHDHPKIISLLRNFLTPLPEDRSKDMGGRPQRSQPPHASFHTPIYPSPQTHKPSSLQKLRRGQLTVDFFTRGDDG